ncbi:MAG TPA: type II toxin-antitoxin system VapB family antitoxin [Candidatus Binataceae bacterium]|nr:type II toxin-antitoxin system VapB family antitoxin [Candidatus Binataceae bacterium]
MRITIAIDEALMKRVMLASGAKTKREAVERGLRLIVQLKRQEKMADLRGKLPWDGDLKAKRRDGLSADR